jgi:phospholipid/cholesterol/gamma-HCH transport system permease protein
VTGSIAELGERGLRLVAGFGGAAQLSAQTLRAGFERRLPWLDVLRAIDLVGVQSFSIVMLTALFTGLVLALQTGIGMDRFGASEYTGYIVSMAIVRELGPVLTALIVGGRVAGGIAAELGSMSVTEQIDALRAMGADPVRKLVLPRVVACMLVLPMLALVADVLGILGGMLITSSQFSVPASYFLETVRRALLLEDVFSGLAKTVFFGFAIAIIASNEGMRARGGTAGVGQATTRAVVASSIGVLILNFFLTKLFLML